MSSKYDNHDEFYHDEYDRHYKYHYLLWIMYDLELLSHEQYSRMHDECWDRLDE